MMKPEVVILKMADTELKKHISPLTDNISTKFHIARPNRTWKNPRWEALNLQYMYIKIVN